jgi:serine/threonine protein kinase
MVWLAVDLAPRSVGSWKHNRFFADQKQLTQLTEIRRAQSFRGVEKSTDEYSCNEELCLRKLMQDRQRDRPGQRNIIELFDAFDIESPNGIYLCLVLEVAGLHFAELTELEGYDFDDAVYLFKQCVETVEYVHSMGISHGGMSVLSPALCVVEADFRGRP